MTMRLAMIAGRIAATAALKLKLQGEAMAADVLLRNIENDRRALALHGLPAKTVATLQQQIASNSAALRAAQQAQVQAKTRLAEIRA